MWRPNSSLFLGGVVQAPKERSQKFRALGLALGLPLGLALALDFRASKLLDHVDIWS